MQMVLKRRWVILVQKVGGAAKMRQKANNI